MKRVCVVTCVAKTEINLIITQQAALQKLSL